VSRRVRGSCSIQPCFPKLFFALLLLPPPFHPHSRGAFLSLGASWVFSFQPVLPPDFRPFVPSRRWKLGQAIDAVTGTRRLNLGLLTLSFRVLGSNLRSRLRRRRQRNYSLVAQRLVRFSTDPQPMQQHRQFACHCDHRSFLPILSPSLRQFESPPS